MPAENDSLAWRPTQFWRAVPGGAPIQLWGYEWRGLALVHAGWATPREATRWTLIHLGSGGAIARLTGRVATVMPVAAEIAECSDWTLFDMPEGWRQTDPELPAKVCAICEAHPEAQPDTDFKGMQMTDADARAVIAAREGADA